MSQVELAIALAKELHASQEYTAGISYFDGHLAPVARFAMALGYDDDRTLAAAYLHDSVEDTSATFDFLRAQGIDEAVVEPIEAVTKRKSEASTFYLARIALVPRAVVVKFADSSRNLAATLEMSPSHPKYTKWMEKYPANLRFLAPLMPNPADLQ